MDLDLWKLWPEARQWAASSYGRLWRKRFSGSRAEREALIPSIQFYHSVIDQPFGRPDWNNRFRLVRYVVAGW